MRRISQIALGGLCLLLVGNVSEASSKGLDSTFVEATEGMIEFAGQEQPVQGTNQPPSPPVDARPAPGQTPPKPGQTTPAPRDRPGVAPRAAQPNAPCSRHHVVPRLSRFPRCRPLRQHPQRRARYHLIWRYSGEPKSTNSPLRPFQHNRGCTAAWRGSPRAAFR